MISPQVVQLVYLVAAVLFIIGLKRLGSPATAPSGNRLSGLGMLLAISITLLDRAIVSYSVIIAGMLVGGAIGFTVARVVKMTSMPQMVALLNGFGGAASLTVGGAEFLRAEVTGRQLAISSSITVQLAVLIGAVTFSGSLIAWGKLQEVLTGRPIVFAGQKVVNATIFAAIVVLSIYQIVEPEPILWPFYAVVLLSLLLGVLLVIPIGGADMPVVISLLNSYSGIAAAMTGFAINNIVLIVAGALVGSSGIILSQIMCRAMNRSLTNVLFGAFGAEQATGSTRTAEGLAELVEKRGGDVRYAIHPVAGRMPGHMNVLLAEANVPYDRLITDVDEANALLQRSDVALVIGANDIVNPAALDDPGSPIYGMPIIKAHSAQQVIVMKRSMASGFAGIENDLFYRSNNTMLFGNAKDTLARLVTEVKEV
jgi:H+-translocating NAD(P) transhydrogenase subunit beta